MDNGGKCYRSFFIAACVCLLLGLAVIASAEPFAFNKANAEYPMGQWAWYNEYRSFIYETTSDNIKTIGLIMSILGAAGLILTPLVRTRTKPR